MSMIGTDCAGAILVCGEKKPQSDLKVRRGFSTTSEEQKRPVLWMGRISSTDFVAILDRCRGIALRYAPPRMKVSGPTLSVHIIDIWYEACAACNPFY